VFEKIPDLTVTADTLRGVTAMRCNIGELYLACMKFKLGNGMFCHWSSIFPKKCGKIEPPYNKRSLDRQPAEGKG